MPFVNIKLAGNISKEQKQELAMRVTEALQDVAGKTPASTYIVFEEVEREDWAVGGTLLSDR
ncbi:MAG TPA: 4-oxalocrotonate tautomerase family protein [Spirochaetota bacterium]|nr:4-oxalocrotonate tautomerase family protein [Spirochaetota bacterium]